MAATTKSLAQALLEVQKSAQAIQRDSINPHFGNRYISLDTLMPQILPKLNEQGVLLTQFPDNLPGVDGAVPALTTVLTLAATGEAIERTTPLILDKDNSQGLGSALTYTRRYALLSILGLVADKDDDGEKATTGQGRGRKVDVVNKRKPAATKKTKTTDDTEGY